MDVTTSTHCTAFADSQCIASGELLHVALKVKEVLAQNERASILIFDDTTCRQVEIDFRGTPADVQSRILERIQKNESIPTPSQPETKPSRGPGRPKLGVVSREVTLLPRHWAWLNQQPGGASVALRKLVEEAKRTSIPIERVRNAQEACYRFMMVMAGNLPGFEEAIRALYARNRDGFDSLTEVWPPDIRNHARKLARIVFQRDTDLPA